MSDLPANNPSDTLYSEVSHVLTAARANVRAAVNTAMVRTYWHIGRLIVEEQQKGEGRADYGDSLIRNLSKRLTADFGRGFGNSNLKYFKQFHLCFPIGHAVSGQLETSFALATHRVAVLTKPHPEPWPTPEIGMAHRRSAPN